MSLFDGRAQRPTPHLAKLLLRRVPGRFRDDGCSWSWDRIWGWSLTFACRVHDWMYCSRCHGPHTMTEDRRKVADKLLRQFLRTAVPWRWGWMKWVYWGGVRFFGRGSFGSCGPEAGELCRHNMLMPDWMQRAKETTP